MAAVVALHELSALIVKKLNAAQRADRSGLATGNALRRFLLSTDCLVVKNLDALSGRFIFISNLILEVLTEE